MSMYRTSVSQGQFIHLYFLHFIHTIHTVRYVRLVHAVILKVLNYMRRIRTERRYIKYYFTCSMDGDGNDDQHGDSDDARNAHAYSLP